MPYQTNKLYLLAPTEIGMATTLYTYITPNGNRSKRPQDKMPRINVPLTAY